MQDHKQTVINMLDLHLGFFNHDSPISHARSPKSFLDDTMKEFPGGTWITMEGNAEGVDLVCCGYKYNKKTVLAFVFTKGAGSTAKGDAYKARFPDKFGNVCSRYVARPSIIASYFKYSNVVDLHNQARQFDLALEKKWVTHNGYFRLFVTILGMSVIDALKVFVHRERKKHFSKRKDHSTSVGEFVDELVAYLIDEGKMEAELSATRSYQPLEVDKEATNNNMSISLVYGEYIAMDCYSNRMTELSTITADRDNKKV